MQTPEGNPFQQLEKDWATAWLKFAESIIGPVAGTTARLKLCVAPVASSPESLEALRILPANLNGQLSESQLRTWQKLQQSGHPGRISEWINARHAELALLSELGPKANQETYQSLSHTRISDQLIALAIGVQAPPSHKIRGVGVDLESAQRGISEPVVERLVKDSEKPWLGSREIQALDFWILKEAAFKATPMNSGAVIADFTIIDWNSAAKQGTVRSSILDRQGLTCRVMKVESAGLKAAFAYVFETGHQGLN